jgi:hypothetical protein
MTGAPTTSKAHDKRWRTILFIVLALVALWMYLNALPGLLAPWTTSPDYITSAANAHNPYIHRWHTALAAAATALLIGGTIFALLWRPRTRPLLNLPFVGPFMFLIVAPIFVLAAAYPAPRALLGFSQEGPFSRPLLLLTLVASVLMAPVLWHWMALQIQGAGESVTTNEWIADVEHTVLLLLAGAAACTKRSGWQVLGVLTGVTFLYLGVAALTVPDQPGSWGIVGGTLAILGGVGYIAATIFEARKKVPQSSVSRPLYMHQGMSETKPL